LKRDGRQQYAHRIIMAEILGRPLTSDEIVHHIDGNKRNNSPDNLELMTVSEHHSLHTTEKNASTKQHVRAANIRWGNI
jgi:hypothetical protein